MLTSEPHRFRPQRADDLFCSSIDMLLNASIFIWYGAVAPWSLFVSNEIIAFPRLVLLGVLVLLLRRLPILLTLKPKITELKSMGQAAFMGFFGPIGVSAIYYLMLGREFLLQMANSSSSSNDDLKSTAGYLEQSMWIIVWFLVMDSVLVHGIALPVGKVFRRLFPTVYKKYFRMNPTEQGKVLDGDVDETPAPYSRVSASHSEETLLSQSGSLYGTLEPGTRAV